ncbi:MAG: LUD domain-containing protein [Candidatus Methanoperedens sp.]|nr:LUD domain-containing protein [Candidatus Methanoperedens sp.]
MNHEQVIALRKTFDTVRQRHNINVFKDFGKRKKLLREARELCVGNEVILEQAVENLRKNGIKVHLVNGKQEAIYSILSEIGDEKLVVKSKSNVTKELGLTKALGRKGVEVVETDIGDRIMQLLGSAPSHPTGPVSHLSAKEIARGLSVHYNKHINDNPDEIVKIVREDVISSIANSKVGITGANAITLEEGSIVLTHNEGNISEVMKLDKHIVVTSIDKLYPDIESAVNMLKILSYNATGSVIPSFVEIITGVSKTADVEKKFIKGVHGSSGITVILVDNKRSQLARNGFRDILYCVGCGNCLLYCPMYNTIGNDYAEENYLGGKGLAYQSIYNDEVNGKLKLCLTCGKCRENCPLELDIPSMVRKIRSDGISSEVYYFLNAHMIWVYYQTLLRLKTLKKL